MARHALEVADIVRLHGEEFARTHPLTLMQRKVLRNILRCRTAELGGHVYRCEGCDYEENSYNSCRDRHCPKCQGSKAQQWVEERTNELLPVSYFHTVFTLPHKFHALVLHNQRLMYNLLFQAVSRTLLDVGERKLHAKLGFLCLLHTWGQTLTPHPHLHVLIPGCGIDTQDGSPRRFHARYLLSDKILSRVFCGKFVALLKRAYRKGKLSLRGDLAMLANEHDFEQLLNEATAARWVVRSKPPFCGPTIVLKYLALYPARCHLQLTFAVPRQAWPRQLHLPRLSAGRRQQGHASLSLEFSLTLPAACPSQGFCPHQVLRISRAWQQSQSPGTLPQSLRYRRRSPRNAPQIP